MKNNMYFHYDHIATDYLCRKDKRLAAAIEQIGHINRPVDSDLFSSVVHHIIGQQISTRAQQTIWQRMQDKFVEVSPQTIGNATLEDLQSVGMTYRKAQYIQEFSQKILDGTFDLQAVAEMPDNEAIQALVALKGIGVWTAEMILLFCLQRLDIFSYDDLAIQRGLRMLYRHKTISRTLFERYRRRFTPYGSVASLYLWAIAGGAIPELTDPQKK